MTRTFFPVSLSLVKRPCLVVGGGRVAVRKVTGLLDACANVTVVAPVIDPRLSSLEQKKKIVCHRRAFASVDIDGKVLVIAATDDEHVQQQVFQAADEKNIPVNVADVPAKCSFIMPAVFRQGPLSVAVSTGGSSPALAAYLRHELEQKIGVEYGIAAELLGLLRPIVLENSTDNDHNRRLFYGLLEQGLVEKIAHNRWDEVKEMVVTAAGEQAAGIVATLHNGASQRSSK